MIAYPSIQEIQIAKDKLALIKYQDKVKENPDSETARIKLAEVTDKLEKRASTAADLAVISESYLLLEKPDKAISYADKAISVNDKVKNAESSSDTDSGPKEEKTNEVTDRMEALHGIKEMAHIQKDIRLNPNILKDSLRLKARIQNVETVSPKIQKYFKEIYIQEKLPDINKNGFK